MSYRQWLIGLAMKGLLSAGLEQPEAPDAVARMALDQANSVLELLSVEANEDEKEPGK